jgi:uncharacterized protein (DUF2249 family)
MSDTAPNTPQPCPDAALVQELAALLAAALRALGDAGQPEAANRLAGRAWSALRRTQPVAAQRINGLMHRLARQQDATTPTIQEASMTSQDPELDVRSEPPPRRHTLIFDTYERLRPGQAFVLVNDHDPKPLSYQFAAEQPGRFSWDYLEQGPEVWRVRIGRTG